MNKFLQKILLEVKATKIPGKKQNERDTEELAKEVYGDDYGKLITMPKTDGIGPDGESITMDQWYGLKSKVGRDKSGSMGQVSMDTRYDGKATNGFFSQGNDKLSPDTLIINFTSAHNCPSVSECPIQMKTCYAVNGESQYPSKLRKELKNQTLVSAMIKKDMLWKYFELAKKYIERSNGNIKWVRFNEVGDFPTAPYPNNKRDFNYVLDMAAKFAYEVRKEFGVNCMAYSANGRLNFGKEIEIDGKTTTPSDEIAINASTDNVLRTLSPTSLRRNFFGVQGDEYFEHNFVDKKNGVWNTNEESDIFEVAKTFAEQEIETQGVEELLDSNPKTEEVSESEIGKLKAYGTLDVVTKSGKSNDLATPILTAAYWGEHDENGKRLTKLAYICPCGFWRDKKDRIEYEEVTELFNRYFTERPNFAEEYNVHCINRARNGLNNGFKLGDDDDKEKRVHVPESVASKIRDGLTKLTKKLSTIPSPCGINCAVCHDMKGGVLLDDVVDCINGKKKIDELPRYKEYAVLTSLHGGGMNNFDPIYADRKRHQLEPRTSSAQGVVNRHKAEGMTNREYQLAKMLRDYYLIRKSGKATKKANAEEIRLYKEYKVYDLQRDYVKKLKSKLASLRKKQEKDTKHNPEWYEVRYEKLERQIEKAENDFEMLKKNPKYWTRLRKIQIETGIDKNPVNESVASRNIMQEVFERNIKIAMQKKLFEGTLAKMSSVIF